jgi:TRAP-type C4-dicarboxylate transport system substrate-binding protein
VQAGEPGKRLFNFIEDAGVVPIAWGENGFREVTKLKTSNPPAGRFSRVEHAGGRLANLS